MDAGYMGRKKRHHPFWVMFEKFRFPAGHLELYRLIRDDDEVSGIKS